MPQRGGTRAGRVATATLGASREAGLDTVPGPTGGVVRSRTFAAALSASLGVALLAACAPTPRGPVGEPYVYDLPPPQVRERPGTFEVTAAAPEDVRRHSTYGVRTPVRGAEEGAGQGIRSLGDVGQTLQMVQMVHPLASLALISGAAIVGAVLAHGEGEVNTTEAALRRTLAEARPQERFADMVASAAARLSEPPQVRRAGADTDLGVRTAGDTQIGATLAAAWTLVPDADDASTLLETGLPEIALTGERGFDPDVSLYVEASVRLLDAQDRAILWQRSYLYRSPPTDFFELGENDAVKLKDMLQRGLLKLAFAASFDVFAARHPEVHPDPAHWSSVPPDEVWAIRRTATPLPAPVPRSTTLAIASARNASAANQACCTP